MEEEIEEEERGGERGGITLTLSSLSLVTHRAWKLALLKWL
jgi:hypothetical protein